MGVSIFFSFEKDKTGCKALKIRDVVLPTNLQNLGIGRQLFQIFEKIAMYNECEYLYGERYDEKGSILSNRGFYEKMGYEKFGTHIFDIGDDPQTDWMMWRRI